MPISVNQNGQQVETAARLDKLQLDWPEAALPRCAGGYRSFRLRGDQLRGVAVLGDRQPSFQRFLSCLAHPREVSRAGRRLSLCRFYKKRNTSRHPPSALLYLPRRCGISALRLDRVVRVASFSHSGSRPIVRDLSD